MNFINKEKNTGIELARILAMLMIVITHLNQLYSDNWRVFYNAGAFVECFIEGVNIFGFISGYLLVHKQFKLSRIVELYSHTMFYMVLWLMIMYIGNIPLPRSYVKMLLFPFEFQAYWYVTAYCGILLAMPMLNRMVRAMSSREHGLCILVILFLSFSHIWGNSGGYSFVWLAFLYIVGAIIRLHEATIRNSIIGMPKILFKLYIVTGLVAFAVYCLCNIYPEIYRNCVLLLRARVSTFRILTSIWVFLYALNCRIPEGRMGNGIRFLGKLCFGVYLLHVNPYCIDSLFPEIKTLYTDHSWYMGIGINFLVLIVVFIGGIACDLIYYKLTCIVHFPKILPKVDILWNRLSSELSRRFQLTRFARKEVLHDNSR